MAKPTHQDANIVLQLLQWSALSGMDEAGNWMWSDAFIPDYAEFVKKYPPGSEEFGYVMKICGWFETIGTLYKQGLFSGELIFDWIAVYRDWDRLKGFALGWRERTSEPRMFENFEAMAKTQREALGRP